MSRNSPRWSRGIGVLDVIAGIALLFILWLVALRQFPTYASRAVHSTPPDAATPAISTPTN